MPIYFSDLVVFRVCILLCSGASRHISAELCVSVRLAVSTYISETTPPNFTRFSEHVACDRDSVLPWRRCIKLGLHGTDTDILADFRARIVARMSACPATSPFSLPRAGHARRSSPTCPPTCPTRALFFARILARMSVRDARVYTYKRVLLLYTITYCVHVYKITR